jgi:tetratricopeptide (TPR) repeat protein
LPDKPRVGAALMGVAIYAFTALAALSKENGALLPLYIAIVESVLLPPFPPNLGKRQKVFLRLLLAAPITALSAYLALSLIDAAQLHALYAIRTFTLSERLQTEVVILWEYLRLGFFPAMAGLGPYHDAHPVYTVTTHPGFVLGSLSAWTAVTGAAVYFRKITPLPLFALGWFLSGHLLESSFIPLELYFEHRNYVPLIGPAYALTIGLGTAIKNAFIRYVLLGAYLAMQLFMLLQTAQLWGDPLKSAFYWADRQPDSIRAAQFLMQQLLRRGRVDETEQTMGRALKRYPDDAAMLLQQLQLRCKIQTLTPELLAQTRTRLRQVRFNSAAVFVLNGLTNLSGAKRCAALDTHSMHGILTVLTGNGGFYHGGGAYHLHHLQARLYEQEKQLAPAIAELEQALKINPTLDTFLRLSSVLIDAGYYDAALRPLADARRHLPSNPFARRYWLEQLSAYTEEIEAYRR